MPLLIFQPEGGSPIKVETTLGISVMAAALAAGVPGILAECGGNCTCGTCQAYFPAEVYAALEPPSEMEAQMLEYVIDPRPTSRLTCRVPVTEALNGALIVTPA